MRLLFPVLGVLFFVAGCAGPKSSGRSASNVVTVAPAMVHSNQFNLVWDSIYEHQTNILLHGDGSTTVTVSRNTNIVYNIYKSHSPTVPMSKWRKVATVSTTNYTCVVTNYPVYFSVRTMDLRTHLESAPGK